MAAAAVSTRAISGVGAMAAPSPSADLPRPYKCPLCDKAFHRLEHQTRHIRTHTGEKPHACTFPGCTKRFSRSDELTRHSRIHSNPHARRSQKAQRDRVGAAPGPGGAPLMAYATEPARMAPPPHMQYHHAGFDMLATAANQLEQNAHAGYPHHRSHPHAYPANNRHPSTSLASYAISNSHPHPPPPHHSHSTSSTATNSPNMSRSHSPARVPHHRSPQSTAPSSPAFSSNQSRSPTPETAAAAAAMRQAQSASTSPGTGVQLPGLRTLSLGTQAGGYAPALAPMEPTVGSPQRGSFSPTYSGSGRLSDILNRDEGSQRKLPVPKMGIAEMLGPEPMDER